MSHRVIAALLCLMYVLGRAPPGWASDPFLWEQPPPDEQLAADDTVIPLGKGGLFVPSLTSPHDEPPVVLVGATEDVWDLPTGKRVVLDPGRYTVIVTSGSPAQGVAQVVEVLDGETTMVPVTWGALRVEVTDAKRVPHRGGYELIRADNREPYGTGFGADTLQGESLLTWLLPPGVYRIVKVGANYRALEDFATVYVPESGFVRFRLVTDRDTGDFLASGMLLPEEFGTQTTSEKPWFTSVIFGADGALVHQTNVVGVQNQLLISGNLFLDGQFVYRHLDHNFSALLQVEEGASLIRPLPGDPLPLVKSRDRLRGDLLYTWFPHQTAGPYVRAAATTQAFRTQLLASVDTDFEREYADGSIEQETVEAGETFHVADPWAPTIIRQGAGLNTRFVNNRWFTLNVRLGFGMRQNLFRGAWLLNDDPHTTTVEYLEVESFNDAGLEGTVVATARLPGWATYATDVEVFADFGRLGAPSLEWRNTLSLRLTRNLSINYYANIELFPEVVERAQFEQSLLLRASWALF
ncbi:MAG: hypothetical protein JRJ84_02240 [Deltaproteobacteria bacterium]|nr:hypothetical protein [Deltaproteobacteria bacterium]